ncbi:MAG TPA: alkaline phosphatase family protein, partial [Dehalococcoidia bacterium]|nr:alkaline phosphatase family protein [Dehalococcoidia bacterium]
MLLYLRPLFALLALAALIQAQGAASAPATASLSDIQHVVVLMQENRSFDEYFGELGGRPATYDPGLDILDPVALDATNPNPSGGPPIKRFHQTLLCESSDVNHSWDGSHRQYNDGAMDGFTAENSNTPANTSGHNMDPLDINGRRIMGYYTDQELPYYYKLFSTFAMGDRFFSSVMTQTFPNRFYLMSGTSWVDTTQPYAEATENRLPMNPLDFRGKSIFELLDNPPDGDLAVLPNDPPVTWKVYGSEAPYAFANEYAYARNHVPTLVVPIAQYFADAAAGTLPQVS